MNRGGLGWLEKSRRMQIPVDLLESMGVLPGHALYGMYYPTELSKSASAVATVKHDFVLSPVPFRHWDKCAHLVVRVKHEPAALGKIAELLDREGVSVVIAEATRSGFRFATWSTQVVLERTDPGEFNDNASVYTGTRNAVEALKHKIETECADALFVEADDIVLQEPVELFAQTALAYFHNTSVVHASGGAEDAWLYKDFTVECAEDGVLLSDAGEIASILRKIVGMVDGTCESTRVIVAVDTRFANIRLSLLPSDALNRFADISVPYERSGPPDNSSGVICGILRILGANFNVWRTHTEIGPSLPNHEKASSFFLVEDVSDDKYAGWDELHRKLTELLPEGKRIKRVPEIRLGAPIIHPLRVETLFPRTGKSRWRRGAYKVFISYSHHDAVIAGNIVDQLDAEGFGVHWDQKTEAGADYSEEIKQWLRGADEVWILCSTASLQSVWTTTEWGAAWALEKYIVPILIDVSPGQLPHQLRKPQAVDQADSARYMKDVIGRRLKLRSRMHG